MSPMDSKYATFNLSKTATRFLKSEIEPSELEVTESKTQIRKKILKKMFK